jgi:hypothetical protein
VSFPTTRPSTSTTSEPITHQTMKPSFSSPTIFPTFYNDITTDAPTSPDIMQTQLPTVLNFQVIARNTSIVYINVTGDCIIYLGMGYQSLSKASQVTASTVISQNYIGSSIYFRSF